MLAQKSPDCIKAAKEAGRKVETVDVSPRPPVGSDTMKCTMTDSACMKQAKQLGKKVELVEEAELDVFRCSATDTDCLKRAKASGKKVEITD